MSRIFLVRALVSAFFAIGATSAAFAMDSAQFCGRNHGSAFLCERDSRCFYSDEIRKCVAYDVDCNSRRDDAWSCRATAGCLWDQRWQDCSEDPRVGQGDLDPYPGYQCSRYDQNPRQCERTPGCRFDDWTGQCERDGGGNHGGNRVVIPCSSHNSAMQTCHVGGVVVSARLLRNNGNYRCYEGSTWGRTTYGIWVKGGCSGDFELIVRRQ